MSKQEKKFEDAFNELEDIVKKLEDGDIELDRALALFEKAVGLAKFCSKKLEDAEKKVEILTTTEDGKNVIKQFELNEEE